MTSSKDNYCFISPPKEIKDEISDLNQKNLLTENCSGNEIKVCFDLNDCDINVNYNKRYVEKDREKIFFEGDTLMYAAIFADPKTYECQLKRLMLRLKEISVLYEEKEIFMGEELCGSNIGLDLSELRELATNLNNSEELEIVKMKADVVNDKNSIGGCMLW